jgi:hypothetical protein
MDFQRLMAKLGSFIPDKAFESSHPIGKIGDIVITADGFEGFTLDNFMYPLRLFYGFLFRPVGIKAPASVRNT